MAGTNRKVLLKIAVEGAQNAETAKEKLAFLQIAMLLYSGATPTKKKIKQTMSTEMKKLLGLSETDKAN
jgi:hypothetical protein